MFYSAHTHTHRVKAKWVIKLSAPNLTSADEAAALPVAEDLTQFLDPDWAHLGVAGKGPRQIQIQYNTTRILTECPSFLKCTIPRKEWNNQNKLIVCKKLGRMAWLSISSVGWIDHSK